MKKVAILQSNYIPWKGYFDLINEVDEFILYDDVQYTRRDWRNRNQIKTYNGLMWLTIPVNVKGKFEQKINETTVNGNAWIEQHWKSLEFNYGKSEYFTSLAPLIKKLYEKSKNFDYISDINYMFIKELSDLMGIETKISLSSDYKLINGKSERLLDLCLQTGATTYLSGPAAQDYLDVNLFESKGVAVEWMSYSGYLEYPQRFPPFCHSVSILDLLFNVGEKKAITYITSKNHKLITENREKGYETAKKGGEL